MTAPSESLPDVAAPSEASATPSSGASSASPPTASSANRPANRVGTPSRRPPWGAIGVGIAVVAVVVLALGLAALAFLNQTGAEFDPITFQRRHFAYRQVFGWAVSPIRRTANDHPDLAAIRSVPTFPASDAASRWDLIRDDWRPWTDESHYDATFLFDTLATQTPPDVTTWADWTKLHPEEAALFWPVVVEMCRDSLYVLLPDLFDRVTSRPPKTMDLGAVRRILEEKLTLVNEKRSPKTPDVESLRTALIAHVEREYSTLVEDERALGHFELADRLEARRELILGRLRDDAGP